MFARLRLPLTRESHISSSIKGTWSIKPPCDRSSLDLILTSARTVVDHVATISGICVRRMLAIVDKDILRACTAGALEGDAILDTLFELFTLGVFHVLKKTVNLFDLSIVEPETL